MFVYKEKTDGTYYINEFENEENIPKWAREDDTFVIVDLLPAEVTDWQTKTQKTSEILEQFDTKMKALVSDYPETEQQTWGVQVEEAKAYLIDNDTDIPMLSEIAGTHDTEIINALCNKIIEKANMLSVATGQLLNWKRTELGNI